MSAAETARNRSAEDRTRLLRAIIESESVEGMDGATDQELQELYDMPGNTERPRRNELVDMGYVKDSGYRRRSRGTTNRCIIWVATVEGMEALRLSL
jgi:hypothetical protein